MTTDVDQVAAQEFAGRMLGVVNAASTAFGLGIGDKLGLFDTLAGLDPSTSQQLADASGMQERYVREWLNGMVVSRVISYNPDDQTYWLPAEHGSVTKAAGPGNLAAFTRFFPCSARSLTNSAKHSSTAEGFRTPATASSPR